MRKYLYMMNSNIIGISCFVCPHCRVRCQSMRHLRNHYNHSHCCDRFSKECSVICYCGDILWRNHSCMFLDHNKSFCCKLCNLEGFKTIEGLNNHCVIAHHSGVFSAWSPSAMIGMLSVAEHARQAPFYATRVNLGYYSQGISFDLCEIEKIKHVKSMTQQTFKKKIVFQTLGFKKEVLMSLAVRRKIILWNKQPSYKFLRKFPISVGGEDFVLVFNSQENVFHELHHLFSPFIRNVDVSFYSQMKNDDLESQSLFSIDHNIQLKIPELLVNLPNSIRENITPEVMKKIVSIILKMMICYKSNWNFDVLCLTIADVLISVGFEVSLSQEVLKMMIPSLLILFGFFFPHKGFVSQSISFDNEKVVKSICTCAAIFFSTLLLKATPHVDVINEIVSNTVKLGNFSRGLTNSWKMFSELADGVYSQVYEIIYGVPVDLKDAHKYLDDVERWYGDVQKYSQLENVEEIATNIELCNKISEVYNQGIVLQRQCVHYKIDFKAKQCIDMHFRIITKLYEQVSRSGAFHQGPKNEPLIIQLFGESGVGKSGLMYLVAAEILKCEDILSGGDGSVDGDTWTNKIYAR